MITPTDKVSFSEDTLIFDEVSIFFLKKKKPTESKMRIFNQFI